MVSAVIKKITRRKRSNTLAELLKGHYKHQKKNRTDMTLLKTSDIEDRMRKFL